MSLLLSQDKCWYVDTDERIGEDFPPMTYAEALMVADLLVANKHKGVRIYKGQLHMEIK
tara:strand:+ start:313 stop:489 length:177 start_codon:yes stop_codon:yes gene_type:complete